MITTLKNFVSNRTHLSIIQFLMYSMIAYIMLQYSMSILEMVIVFSLLFTIQFLTRIKAVADGMMFRQLMTDYEMDANDIVQKIKEQAQEARRNNDIN